MKPRRGERIIDTETIEIKADLPETIERRMPRKRQHRKTA